MTGKKIIDGLKEAVAHAKAEPLTEDEIEVVRATMVDANPYDALTRHAGERLLATINALRAERDALAGEVERQRARIEVAQNQLSEALSVSIARGSALLNANNRLIYDHGEKPEECEDPTP